MALTTKILTAAQVQSLATNLAEFDITLIERFILPAQRRFIKVFLSDDYYEAILDGIENLNLDADSSALIGDYLQPALAYYTMYMAIPFLRNEIRSGGIVINSTETSDTASSADVNSLRQAVLAMAEQWKHDAEEFIKEQQDDDASKFPDFSSVLDDNKNKYIFIPYGTNDKTQNPDDIS